MATVQAFEELEVWQKARELVKNIYEISNRGAFAKDFGLRDQVRRAAVSILANIAEGFERGGTGEFVQFLAVAKGSAGELRAHLYVAFDQGYIDEGAFEQLRTASRVLSRMVSGLMAYLQKSGYRGSKKRHLEP